MTTYPHHGLHVHRPHVNAWLVAVVGLAAALIGLGAWVLVDRYAGGSSATENAATLIGKAEAAFSTGDANAIATLYTSDAVIRTSDGGLYSAQEFAQLATSTRGVLRVERIAPVTLNGDFATTWEQVTSSAGTEASQQPLLSVFQLKDGQILRQWNFDLYVEPFANAVMP